MSGYDEPMWLVPVIVIAVFVVLITGCCVFQAAANKRRRRAYRAAVTTPYEQPPLPTPLPSNMSYYPPNIVVGMPAPIQLIPVRPMSPSPPQYVDLNAVPTAVYATRSRLDNSQQNFRM